MLRVKTRLLESPIEGIGLFADEFIPVGTVTWKYDPEFDMAYDEAALDRVPECSRETIIKRSYYDHNRRVYILCSDNQGFINHSENPNIESTPDEDRTLRDIQKKEEMVCRYTDYENDWFERRGKRREDFR